VAQNTSALLRPSLALALVFTPRCLTPLIAFKMSLDDTSQYGVTAQAAPVTAEAAALAAATRP